MNKARGIITASLLVTALLGSLNSIIKYNKLPSFRFYFGTGVLFLMLEGLAEWEDEIAKSIAIAIVTFTVLGEGGGVLDHFFGRGTASTTLNTQPSSAQAQAAKAANARQTGGGAHPYTVVASRRDTGINAPSSPAGFAPAMPILPTTQVHVLYD